MYRITNNSIDFLSEFQKDFGVVVVFVVRLMGYFLSQRSRGFGGNACFG